MVSRKHSCLSFLFQSTNWFLLIKTWVFFSVARRKRRIMEILDQHCAEENDKLRQCVGRRGKAVKSEYDFLYVPIDFGYGYRVS